MSSVETPAESQGTPAAPPKRPRSILSLTLNGREREDAVEKLGAQCGYCTPGMITAAEALLLRNPQSDRDEINAALGGNLGRCTGYVKIIESVEVATAIWEAVR